MKKRHFTRLSAFTLAAALSIITAAAPFGDVFPITTSITASAESIETVDTSAQDAGIISSSEQSTDTAVISAQNASVAAYAADTSVIPDSLTIGGVSVISSGVVEATSGKSWKYNSESNVLNIYGDITNDSGKCIEVSGNLNISVTKDSNLDAKENAIYATGNSTINISVIKGVIFDLKGTIPIDVPSGYVNMTGGGIIHLDSYTDDFVMKVKYDDWTKTEEPNIYTSNIKLAMNGKGFYSRSKVLIDNFSTVYAEMLVGNDDPYNDGAYGYNYMCQDMRITGTDTIFVAGFELGSRENKFKPDYNSAPKHDYALDFGNPDQLYYLFKISCRHFYMVGKIHAARYNGYGAEMDSVTYLKLFYNNDDYRRMAYYTYEHENDMRRVSNGNGTHKLKCDCEIEMAVYEDGGEENCYSNNGSNCAQQCGSYLINEKNFPDENFRNYLQSEYGASNSNGDWITPAKVSEIDISGRNKS